MLDQSAVTAEGHDYDVDVGVDAYLDVAATGEGRQQVHCDGASGASART